MSDKIPKDYLRLLVKEELSKILSSQTNNKPQGHTHEDIWSCPDCGPKALKKAESIFSKAKWQCEDCGFPIMDKSIDSCPRCNGTDVEER